MKFTVQLSKLNGLGKTHRESIFVVELKLKLRTLFHYEQIIWENSDIKWMKVPSFSLSVTKYLTFLLSRYFLWTIKINCKRFLGRLSTNVMTLLLIQIHQKPIFFCQPRPTFSTKQWMWVYMLPHNGVCWEELNHHFLCQFQYQLTSRFVDPLRAFCWCIASCIQNKSRLFSLIDHVSFLISPHTWRPKESLSGFWLRGQ